MIAKHKTDVLTSLVVKSLKNQTLNCAPAPSKSSLTKPDFIIGQNKESVIKPEKHVEVTASVQTPIAKEEVKNEPPVIHQIKKTGKYTITKCPHTTRKYYAKGMCNHCYHHFGRPNLATKCIHKDRMNFAKNMCLGCYQKNKFMMKKQKQLEQKADKAASDDESADGSAKTKMQTPVIKAIDKV